MSDVSVSLRRKVSSWLRGRLSRLLYRRDYRRLEGLSGEFSGKRCFLLGSGPSLGKMDLGLLKNEFTCVVNAGVRAVENGLPQATMHVCLDNNRYRRFHGEFERLALSHPIPYRFFNWRMRRYWKKNHSRAARPYFLRAHPADFHDRGYSGDFSEGISGANTVLVAAAQILCNMGFSQIYILGCDLDYDGENGKYFYQMGELDKVHEQDGKVVQRRENMRLANRDFRDAQEALAPYGTRLFNAGVGGNLTALERVEFVQLFNEAAKRLKDEKRDGKDKT